MPTRRIIYICCVQPFVLLLVHFPSEMDESSRQLAFELGRPKADVVRLFIRLGLDILKREAGSPPGQNHPNL